MNVALKELVETRMWLRIIIMQKFLSEKALCTLLQEAEELAKIFHASVMTARKRIAAGSYV
jgi:four helix bundle protein